MSNRKKLTVGRKRSNIFRSNKKRVSVDPKGKATVESNNDLLTRLFSEEGQAARVEQEGNLLWNYESLVKLGIHTGEDDDEKSQIVRIVTAKADGVPTGLMFIWDTGEVSYWEDKDADPLALAKVAKVAREVGYSLEEGRPFAIGEAGGPDGPPKED
jgi:hypothetical protein